MIYLVILSMLVISAYTTAVCIKCKDVPNSISATFYAIEHKLWFGATMWLTAGLLMPAILEISTENSQWSAFLACAGMMLVGAAPNFNEQFECKIHTVGATMCLLFSQVWVAFNDPWFLMVWLGYIIPTTYYVIKDYQGSVKDAYMGTKPMFWLEIFALINTYAAILL